jgi:LmbE family N-acetylglucosaminyl deacetylase
MNVLIVSVHPDDETLGCGGTILRHVAAGDQIHWVIITQVYEPQWPAEVFERKAQEVQAVAKAYSMKSVHKLGMPTVKMDQVPLGDVIGGLRKVIAEVRPGVVYLPHHGDVHTDHHVGFLGTLSVLKAFYMGALGVERVLSYETLSSTEAAPPLPYRAFIPNVYRDITPYIDSKLAAMDLYASESQPDPMPRGPSAIRALARYRGASVGLEYAEAFMLLREVV